MSENKRSFNITIEHHSIFRDIIKNIWCVILATLTGLMVAYSADTAVYSPVYTSVSTLVVSIKTGNYASASSLSVSSEMAKVFAEVFVQPSIKSRAAEYAELPGFDGTVSAEVKEGTNIIQLSVTSPNPEHAWKLLNGVLAVHSSITDMVVSNALITVLKTPTVPVRPSNRMSGSNKLAIVFGCAVTSLLAILALSILRDTVKDEKSFNEKIEGKLIGTIVHEKKRQSISDRIKGKKSGLLIHTGTHTSLKFSESFGKLAARFEYLKRKNGSKLFAITSIAENEGKSTIASDIAIALAIKGNKVLLLDLDARKPALYKLFGDNYKEGNDLSELLSGKVPPSEFKFKRFKKTSLFLAFATKPNSGYNDWVDNGTIENVLAYLKDRADFVIIDSAPFSVDSTVTNVVKMADETILVVRTDVVKAAVINDTIITINDVGGHLAGCVLNDVYSPLNIAAQKGFDEGGYYSSHRYDRYARYSRYGKYDKYSAYSKYDRYGQYSAYGKYSEASAAPVDLIIADELKNSSESIEDGELI